MGFVRVAKVVEIAPGTIREVQVDGKTLAVANVAGKFYAINNTCIHRGGPLGQGTLEECGDLSVAWVEVRRFDRQGEP